MKEISLRLDVLDLELVDAEGVPVGRVDDVELVVSGGPPRVASLLSGQAVLGRRLADLVGDTLTRIARRFSDQPDGPGLRVEVDDVQRWGAFLELRARLEDLPRAAPLERWLSLHVVRRIPGARDAGQ